MKTPQHHRLVVIYPNGKVRERRVQRSVYPTPQELGFVGDINAWYLHVRVMTDLLYNATHAIETKLATENLLHEVYAILKTPPGGPHPGPLQKRGG